MFSGGEGSCCDVTGVVVDDEAGAWEIAFNFLNLYKTLEFGTIPRGGDLMQLYYTYFNTSLVPRPLPAFNVAC